jgi:hypothetical protein
MQPLFFHVLIPRILDAVGGDGWGISPNKEIRFFDDFSILI